MPYEIRPLKFRKTLANLWEAESAGCWYSFWKEPYDRDTSNSWRVRMGESCEVSSYFTRKQAVEACNQHNRERLLPALIDYDLQPNSNHKSKVASELLKAMEGFVKHLKSGSPVTMTTVRQEQTPDGPLTTRRKKTI